jgi:hypothetical protein
MELNYLPAMETGSPLPEIEKIGEVLRCSYICSNPDFPGWDSGENLEHIGFDEYCAVIEFEGVSSYKFGAPNDESLYQHPSYKMGVGFYGFYKLTTSPELELLPNHFLWVFTFHDETLQVVARSLKILSRRANTNSPKEALDLEK